MVICCGVLYRFYIGDWNGKFENTELRLQIANRIAVIISK